MTSFHIQLENILQNLKQKDKKPRLLLHACCAPCASYCLEYLKEYFDIKVYFYNPNIDSSEEYSKRAQELEHLIRVVHPNISLFVERFDNQKFYDAINGYESEQERGKRCWICYALRLEATAILAKQQKFDYFASTLSISPYKDVQKLNEIANQLSEKHHISHLPNDFKKNGGYARSIILSKQYQLYRQDFCGCEFSKK